MARSLFVCNVLEGIEHDLPQMRRNKVAEEVIVKSLYRRLSRIVRPSKDVTVYWDYMRLNPETLVEEDPLAVFKQATKAVVVEPEDDVEKVEGVLE